MHSDTDTHMANVIHALRHTHTHMANVIHALSHTHTHVASVIHALRHRYKHTHMAKMLNQSESLINKAESYHVLCSITHCNLTVLINKTECYHVHTITLYNLTLSLSTTKNAIMYAVSLIITSHCPYQQQRMLSCMQCHSL